MSHRNLGNVLLVGDSITQGRYGDTGGWRRPLAVSLAAAGIWWTPRGQYNTYPGACEQIWHAGLGGNTAAVRLASINAQCTAAEPDIIVWGLGVNDIAVPTTPAQYILDMTALLDAADALYPSVKHIVQSILVPTAGAGTGYLAEYATANASLATLCAGRARCTFVDMGTQPTSDGVHPTDAGYSAMAALLYPVLLAVG